MEGRFTSVRAMATHELDIAQFAKRVRVFGDGKIRKDDPVLSRPRASEVLKTLPTLEDYSIRFQLFACGSISRRVQLSYQRRLTSERPILPDAWLTEDLRRFGSEDRLFCRFPLPALFTRSCYFHHELSTTSSATRATKLL
jgi:hypothetical protein